MSLRKLFCPFCGSETQIDENKPSCFCIKCGKKIELENKKSSDNTSPMIQVKNSEDNSVPNIPDKSLNNTEQSLLNKKLEEVDFYYELSNEKKEYANITSEPIYYLKAQDLLIELSEQYPNSYKVWWELCKPIDYLLKPTGEDLFNQFLINEVYFNKALDAAELSQKRELIKMHDEYIENKKKACEVRKEALLKEKAEHERAMIEARKQEEEKAREKAELQRIANEKQKSELEKRKKIEAEIANANYIKGLKNSSSLWESLSSKKYSLIDNSYFKFQDNHKKTYICIFKTVSNILYLMGYRIDENNPNPFYSDQSLAIKFDNNGNCTRYNNSLIRLNGLTPPNNIAQIRYDHTGNIYVSEFPLTIDESYVRNVIKSAKKPLLSLSKIFI